MISFKQYGDFNKIEKLFSKTKGLENVQIRLLNKYGKEGVRALSAATPIDSGETASSWSYEIRNSRGSISIQWNNSHIVNGVPIAIILQYGHGTRNGGYVEGRDYINPALKPIFDKMANEAWKELTR